MCEPERIVRGGCFAVAVCSASHTTLTVGPVTLRLERKALDQLARVLRTATQRLVVRDEHGPHWREIVHAPDLDLDDES